MHTPMPGGRSEAAIFRLTRCMRRFHLSRACCWPGWLYWCSSCPQGEKKIRPPAWVAACNCSLRERNAFSVQACEDRWDMKSESCRPAASVSFPTRSNCSALRIRTNC